MLYEYEKELARTNYEKEEERYKLLTEKAKATFLVAALIGSIGLGKFGDIFLLVAQSPSVLRWAVLIFVVVSLVSLGISVILAVFALSARKCKAVARCSDYVDLLYNKNSDTMSRSFAEIYQATADHNAITNEKLALQVNWSMRCTTISFVLTIVLVGMYSYATWHATCGLPASKFKEVQTMASDKGKIPNVNDQKQLKPPDSVKVEPRIVTSGADKRPVDTIIKKGIK